MRKKILFVYPSSYDGYHRIIKSRKSFIPSRTLPYLAALTPKEYKTRIIDELVDDLVLDEDVDLVALTGMLRHIPRAIDIAKEFQRRGKTTIIGGVGAFALKEEIEKSGAFDSIVIGEADELWKEILNDFEKCCLKKRYECTHPPQLNGLPPARFDLLDYEKYMKSFLDIKNLVVPIETSRGCPHNCRFCLVTQYFGKRMRYRPVAEVVDEIKHHKSKHILFTDDNIAINPTRARELFLAIKPLGIQWFGQFESRIVEHPELLRLAAESGCHDAFVGIESLIRNNLDSMNKSHSTKLDFKDVAKAFKEAGVSFFPSLIFGMGHDTPRIIEWTMEEMIKNAVDAVIPWMLTPVPRTACYEEYKNEGRLIHEDYSLYDSWHVVIKPKQMTPEELTESFWRGLRRFYSIPSILQRAYLGKRRDISWFSCNLYFRQLVNKGLHPFAGNS